MSPWERHLAVRDRAALVSDIGDELLGELVEFRQGVVALAHPSAKLGVAAPRLLGGRDRLTGPSSEFAVEADDGRERLIGEGA